MGLLDPYIAQYHTEVKPVIMRGADRAERYAATICDRLGHIHRELSIDRDPGEVMAVNFTVDTAGTPITVLLVPAGEQYVLEAMSLDGSVVTPAGVRVMSDGNFRFFLYPPHGMPVSPIRFVGPCQITLEPLVQATAYKGYIQFKRLAKRARPTQSGGLVETGLDAVDALREHDPLHSGIGIG